MTNTKKYLPILIISLIIPTIFLFATKDIKYETPVTDQPTPDKLYVSGKGWPLPIYDVRKSGGIAGINSGPETNWGTLIIDFLIIFVASFSIGALIMALSRKK